MRCSARSFGLRASASRGAVGGRVGVAARRALDRLGLDRAVARRAQEALRRRAQHGALAHAQVGAVRRGVDAPQDAADLERVGQRRQRERVRQADLVALARLEQAPARRDVREVVLAAAAEGEVRRALRVIDHGRLGQLRQRVEPRGGGGQPGVGAGDAGGAAVAERQHVRLLEAVVDDDEPVGQQQERVGQLGLVRRGRAAVGLQLVAEVADEAAVEVERQLGALRVQARELTAEVRQQRLVADAVGSRLRHRQLRSADAVAQLAAQLAVRRAHEREAREGRIDAAGVQPERGLAVAEDGGERALGVARAREHAVRRPHGAARARRRAAAGHDRAGRQGGAAAGRSRVAPRCHRDEVRHELRAVLGADRLGMKLHAPGGPAAVADRHQRAVLGPGDGFQRGRQGRLDDQRVVAHGAEALGDPGEEAVAAVVDAADAAVDDRVAAHDGGAVDEREALVAEADAEHRDLALSQSGPADAQVALALGPPGTG
jgi:hypothetical protein